MSLKPFKGREQWWFNHGLIITSVYLLFDINTYRPVLDSGQHFTLTCIFVGLSGRQICLMSFVVTNDVESLHHVFLVAALLVWLHHASVVCLCVCGYVCVLRSVSCGFERRSSRNSGWCLVQGGEDTGTMGVGGEAGAEYWLSLCLTWSVSVFVSEIWWPHQLSRTCLTEGVCAFVGVCVCKSLFLLP